MWRLELKLYGKQQKITGTTKSVRELLYDKYSKIPDQNYPSTESLIDGIITNDNYPVLCTSVVELGFSDHLAQIVRISIGKRNRRTKTIVRRQFTYNKSIEEFKHLLSKEVWNDVYNSLDVNSSLEAFLDTFLQCFNIAFP